MYWGARTIYDSILQIVGGLGGGAAEELALSTLRERLMPKPSIEVCFLRSE